MPARSTKDDVVTRYTLLLFAMWTKGGVKGTVSAFAVDVMGYPDDTAVNRNLHTLEEMGLVRERLDLGAWELTSQGRDRISPLVWTRRLTYFMLLLSVGVLVWGVYGILLNSSFAPWTLLVSGLTFVSVSVVVIFMQLSAETRLIGKKEDGGIRQLIARFVRYFR